MARFARFQGASNPKDKTGKHVGLRLSFVWGGRVEGRIEDPSGRPVPGAVISLRSGQQTLIAIARSDGGGGFSATAAGSGSFALRVEAAGFAPHQEIVRAAEAETIQVRVSIRLGWKVRKRSVGRIARSSVRIRRGGAVHLVSRMPAFSAAGNSIRGEVGKFYQSAANAFGSQARLAWSGTRAVVSGALQARRVNRVRTGGGLDSHAAVTRFLGRAPDFLGPRMGDTGFTQYGGTIHAQVQISPLDHLSVQYERGQQDGARRYDQLLGGDGNLVADLRNLMLDFGYLRWQRLQAGWLEQMSASVSYTARREERVHQGGQGNPLGAITHQYERLAAWGVQAQGEKWFAGHTLSMGGEGCMERMRSPAYSWSPATGAVTLTRTRVPGHARSFNYGLYLQEAWAPERARRLRVSAALRWGGGSYRSRARRTAPW